MLGSAKNQPNHGQIDNKPQDVPITTITVTITILKPKNAGLDQKHCAYFDMKSLFMALAGVATTTIIFLSLRQKLAGRIRSKSSADLPIQSGRALSLTEFSDPRSVGLRSVEVFKPITVVNVYYTLPVNDIRKPSILETNLLERYGSGNVKYNIIYNSDCNCNEGPIPTEDGSSPCVATGRCPLEDMKCRYPTCTTLRVDDELCRAPPGYDARMYRTANQPQAVYIPLGHRMDSWESFQRATNYAVDPIVLPSSEREYVFNAIYSENTNRQERRYLHMLLETPEVASKFPAFVDISIRWNRHANKPETEQLNSDDYIKVLMNSVFTLSPMGNNPECYRIYEAVEAGSIPVTVLGKNYQNHVCKGSIDDWVDSPMIILKSWDDLVETMNDYMTHPKALAKRQYNMMVWYKEYMHRTIGDFENLVVSNPLLLTE